jgi:hypothetical protein
MYKNLHTVTRSSILISPENIFMGLYSSLNNNNNSVTLDCERTTPTEPLASEVRAQLCVQRGVA